MADEITSSSSPGYRSGCHAISRFGRHLGLAAWHILPRSHVFSFAHRDLVRYLFLDTRLPQMKQGRVCVCNWFVYRFFSQFLIDLQFRLYGKLHSKIIRHVDIMLTIYFAHGSCFDRLKLHQRRSTI